MPVTVALRAWSDKDSKLGGGSVLTKLNEFDAVGFSQPGLLTDYIAELEVKNRRLAGTILFKSDSCLYLYIINNLNAFLVDIYADDHLLAAVVKECRDISDGCIWKICDEHTFPENLVRKTTDLIKAHEMLPKITAAHALLAIPPVRSYSSSRSVPRHLRGGDAPRPGFAVGLIPTRKLEADKSRSTGAGHFFRGGQTNKGGSPIPDDEKKCQDCSFSPCLFCGGRDHSVGWCPRSEGISGTHCAPGDKEQWYRAGRERQATYLANRHSSNSFRRGPPSETGNALIAAASVHIHRSARACPQTESVDPGWGRFQVGPSPSNEEHGHDDHADMDFAMQARLSEPSTFPRVEHSNTTGVTSHGILDGGCNKFLLSAKFFIRSLIPALW